MAERGFQVGDEVRCCHADERGAGRATVFVILELKEKTWGTAATIEPTGGGLTRSGVNTKRLVHAR